MEKKIFGKLRHNILQNTIKMKLLSNNITKMISTHFQYLKTKKDTLLQLKTLLVCLEQQGNIQKFHKNLNKCISQMKQINGKSFQQVNELNKEEQILGKDVVQKALQFAFDNKRQQCKLPHYIIYYRQINNKRNQTLKFERILAQIPNQQQVNINKQYEQIHSIYGSLIEFNQAIQSKWAWIYFLDLTQSCKKQKIQTEKITYRLWNIKEIIKIHNHSVNLLIEKKI